ncbi:MAG: PDZ domain-containing protein, partial [Bacteroidota bacterium]
MLNTRTFSLLLLLLTAQLLPAQHLVRRGSMGFQPIPVTDSIAKAHRLKSPQGLLVGNVRPNGTWAALKVEVGDIVLRIQDRQANDFPTLIDIRDQLQGGSDIEVVVWRKGKEKKLKGEVTPVPMEQSTDRYEVMYEEAAFQTGYLRTIINKPRTPGPHPTIYFIPGYTCASVDNMNPIHPYRKLIDSLANLDYVIFRIE